MRHPAYAGLLHYTVRAGPGRWGNWLSVVALTVIPTLGLLVRIRVEDDASTAALSGP